MGSERSKALNELLESQEEFAKKTKEAAAWMDGSGYLHAKPKDDKESKSI
jgi:hypothetical protein